MKKQSPIYLFVILISLTVTGFAFFVISINLGSLAYILPIALTILVFGFFMYIAKAINTSHFEQRLKIKMMCPYCKEEIDAQSEFCPKCGVNLNDKVECDYCGHMNPIDAPSCQNCKANLK